MENGGNILRTAEKNVSNTKKRKTWSSQCSAQLILDVINAKMKQLGPLPHQSPSFKRREQPNKNQQAKKHSVTLGNISTLIASEGNE